MKQFLVGLLMVFTSMTGFAQITGTVVDAESNSPLPGATVVIKGTQIGTTTDFDGLFSISDASEGDTLVITFIGFDAAEVEAFDGMEVVLETALNQLSEVVVTSGVIDIAKVRETPVAVSAISVSEITLKTGNLEFPEIMNKTPGVYATKQGGGYGDSRISLRGFDQRNTSFLINGQPVNDMENGWVYWSNWQGLTDVASGIQIQRGLGASRLAVPSVGGTVSIFTKAAQKMRVVRYYKWLVTMVTLRPVYLTIQVKMKKDGYHLSYYRDGKEMDTSITQVEKVTLTSQQLVTHPKVQLMS